MTVKKLIRKIHLCLGLASGLVVVLLGITGCILAFQKEIESVSNPYQFVKEQHQDYLLPSQLKETAQKELPGKRLLSVTYGEKNKAGNLLFYNEEPEYYYFIYINPYHGEVLKVKNMNRDFFHVVVLGHYYLWLPPHIGQPIVASAALIFLVMMITGLILWWPLNRAARKKRFIIRWNVMWRRNYDLHYVLGFYMTWIAIFITITGLVMGFQWFAKAMYWVTSGGKEMVQYYEPVSDISKKDSVRFIAVDEVWKKMKASYPLAEEIDVYYPVSDSSIIRAGANPDAGTNWKTDFRYFDPYSLNEINVSHPYGRFSNTTVADKIARMNYDVHVGAIGGLPTKILVFCAGLIAASLPITGFLIWRGRKNKKKDTAASDYK